MGHESAVTGHGVRLCMCEILFCHARANSCFNCRLSSRMEKLIHKNLGA